LSAECRTIKRSEVLPMTEPKTEPAGTPAPPSNISRIRHFVSQIELPSPKAQVLFWGLFAAGLAMDLWSKKAVFDRLSYQGDLIVVIDGLLNFVCARNNGAAFGICAGQPFFLAAALQRRRRARLHRRLYNHLRARTPLAHVQRRRCAALHWCGAADNMDRLYGEVRSKMCSAT